MFELWIMVVGGESEEERIVCRGGKDEIEEAIQKYEDEVSNGMDKYFSIMDTKTGAEWWGFETYESYCENVRDELPNHMARLLGELLLTRR